MTEREEVLNQYEYDAWGNITESREKAENRFKFNGQQFDSISQQYYLRARYYNPVIGRFTQEDTYRGDGLNLYAYCANNPVYYVDPSGNICKKAADRIMSLMDEGRIKGKNKRQLESYLRNKINNGGLNPAEQEVANKLNIDNKGVSNPNKYCLSGEEHYESLNDLFGADNVKWETKASKYDNAVFADDEKLVSHYWKHRNEFGAYSLDDYLNQARDVMNNGYEVNYPYKGEIRTGFLEYYGTSQKNGAKFAFVGTNNEGFITTFHTESGKTFWKMLNGENIKIINPK